MSLPAYFFQGNSEDSVGPEVGELEFKLEFSLKVFLMVEIFPSHFKQRLPSVLRPIREGFELDLDSRRPQSNVDSPHCGLKFDRLLCHILSP